VGYAVGEKVWLSTKYLDSKTTNKKEAKLLPKFIGPFQVLEIVNEVSYRLELPKEYHRVHPVFHASLLKKYFTGEPKVVPELISSVVFPRADWRATTKQNQMTDR
jgi:hypothetical protein